MNRLTLLQGRWRLYWGFCPACNSDAPAINTCPVCKARERVHPSGAYPPSDAEKAEWWQRFIAPPAPANCCMVFVGEHWLKRSWRFILQAYHRHQESVDPAQVKLAEGFYRKGDEPEVYRQPGDGLTEVKPPTFAKDALYTRVTVSISFLDLLRCLLGCKLHVDSVTYCENPPGACKTETQAFATFD